ncbi:hypothetical protein ElyMa_001202200 [Elysia marginata]|uniref:Uncharacterized protein n=1 Tax=Elysia marginata TaxID=1093978 RepID=A0AAV4IA32_9GAST|nr:hypothetical protein ElyMa_001202200 [Elysia marginata]
MRRKQGQQACQVPGLARLQRSTILDPGVPPSHRDRHQPQIMAGSDSLTYLHHEKSRIETFCHSLRCEISNLLFPLCDKNKLIKPNDTRASPERGRAGRTPPPHHQIEAGQAGLHLHITKPALRPSGKTLAQRSGGAWFDPRPSQTKGFKIGISR